MSDSEDDIGVLIAAKDAALKPIKAAISPRARRVYLSTALFAFAASILLGFAAVAYITFYSYFIPVRGFTQPIHFSWLHSAATPQATIYPPHSNLVSDQPYDIQVELHLPRSTNNIQLGNFMVDVALLSSTKDGTVDPIAQSTRPTILTYRSPLLEFARKCLVLPLYVIGWRTEAETLLVPIMEGVVFRKGRQNIPTSVRVQLLNAADIQLYNATIIFKARLRGLRYLMYNWRVSSFVVFTSTFWGFELASMVILWLGLSMFTSYKPTPAIKKGVVEPIPGKPEIGVKSEDAPAQIKQEEAASTLADYPTATEADIEDEDEPEPLVMVHSYRGASDSGIGTSLESSASKSSIARKRSSRGNLGDDR